MKRKKLRRVAILVLVLVLLFNTLGAKASTKKDPDVTVNGYWELINAFNALEAGSVIGVTGTIEIQLNTLLGAEGKYFTIRRMAPEAKLVFNYYNDSIEGSSTVKNIYFDGNSPNVGGTQPFLEINHKVSFDACEFVDCFNQSGNGGAINIINRDISFSSCIFEGNSASYGSHIYSTTDGVLNFEYCKFIDGWADEAGGALYLGSHTTTYLRNCTVTDNHSRVGGGVYNTGSLDITESLIYKNEATIQGADIANEGSLTNHTTEDQYNELLSGYGLYYAGWEDDTNTSIGGAGDYLKFLTTTEDPNAPVPTEPITPTEPTEPEPTTPAEPTDPVEPITPIEPVEPTDPEPTEPVEPTQPTDPQEPTEPTPTDPEPSTPSIGDKDDPIATPSNPTDNSTTNNSQSSSNNSSSSVSNVDNSSSVSNSDTDNSRSESSKTENSNNSSTVNNYYQQEQAKQDTAPSPQNASQPVNVTVPVNVSVPEAGEANTGTTASPEDTILTPPQQNIKIEAEGVDLVYEYTENGVTIFIKASKGAEGTAPAVTPISTATNAPESSQQSSNWVEVVSMLLLAILVLGEIKDKIKPHKEA